MNKKIIIPVSILILVLIGGGVFAANRAKNKPEETVVQEKPKKKRLTAPVNVLDQSNRPYIQIIPLADGRNIRFAVSTLPKPATNIDYEMEYKTADGIKGFRGFLRVNDVPAESENRLLGTCSAGGACTYHEGVEGGTITSEYSGGDEEYALRSDWRYFKNTRGETEFSLKPAKESEVAFSITATNLAQHRYIIVMDSSGFPGSLPATAISKPYTVVSTKSLSGTATVSILADEESPSSIYGWNGTAWTKLDSTMDGKVVTGEGDLMELYVVGKDS